MYMNVAQSCPTLCDPVDCSLPGSLSMELSRPEYWSRSLLPFPGDLPFLRLKPRSPPLQADSLPCEPPGKPKNTGVGSLSLLQQIFLTQDSKWGLLHCRQILYQLNYQGSPLSILIHPKEHHVINIPKHTLTNALCLNIFICSLFLYE